MGNFKKGETLRVGQVKHKEGKSEVVILAKLVFWVFFTCENYKLSGPKIMSLLISLSLIVW